MRSYRFGDFELDLEAVQLRRQGKPVRLERRPLDLLILLVTRHGNMVAREDIIAALWPSNVVIDFEAGINTLVRKVRGALGDAADEPQFIETVPGRGYRFIGAVAPMLADAESAPIATNARSRRRRLAAPAALGLLVAAAALVVLSIGASDRPATSIVVLPFENRTGSEEVHYLALGLAEDAQRSLKLGLPGLRTIDLETSRALAESARPVQEARELGIDYLVRGTLHADGAKIRLHLTLVRTRDSEETILGGGPFDRELIETDGLKLIGTSGLSQDLGLAIAEQVKLYLSPGARARIERLQTQNAEAYAWYLKARAEWFKITPDAHRLALEYYYKAVEADDGFALAWAGIAHALVTSRYTIGADVATVEAQARAALQKAMDIDPELAEAHIAQAYMHNAYDRDPGAAEAAGKRALELDPNSAIAHMQLGTMLSGQQRHSEALELMRRARDLEPRSALVHANSSHVARQASLGQDALYLARQAIAIDEANWAGYLHLGYAHLLLGDFAAAADAFLAAEGWSRRPGATDGPHGYALARVGEEREARAILAALEVRFAQGAAVASDLASVHAGLGQNEAALDLLERALATHETNVNDVREDLTLVPLRDEPRFRELLRCGAAC